MSIKKISYTILVIILIIIVICVSLGNRREVDYMLQQFERNEVCNRRLSMYYGETSRIGLGIEEVIYTEEGAKEYLKKIESDIKIIEKEFIEASNQGINVYITQEPIDNSPYIGDNTVYCTVEDIANNTYRTGLIRACYNLTEPAIIHGLEGYVFGRDIDIENLRNYYSETEDLSILSLFGGRFYEGWNTEEEIKRAKQTATSLVSYFIEQDKVELILFQEIGSNEKREWLASIGVNKVYENPYEGKFNTFTFSKSREYPLIINSVKANYYIKNIKYLSTSKEVEEFIYKDYEGREYILNYLEQNAPNNFKYINTDIKPEYFFTAAAPDLGGATGGTGRIWLAAPFVHLHEYVHILTGISMGENKLWMQEGLADYLSRVIYPNNYLVQLDFLRVTANDLPVSPEYYAKAMKYYKDYGGEFNSGNINRRLYEDARVYGSLNSIEKAPSDSKSIGASYLVKDKYKEGGNELVYSQASSFTAYLIDKFSLDTYLGYYIGDKRTQSFEEAFGLTYEDAKQCWLEYLYRYHH